MDTQSLWHQEKTLQFQTRQISIPEKEEKTQSAPLNLEAVWNW